MSDVAKNVFNDPINDPGEQFSKILAYFPLVCYGVANTAGLLSLGAYFCGVYTPYLSSVIVVVLFLAIAL